MKDKCFCHLNGYAVKDANARQRIAVIEEKLENGVPGGSTEPNLVEGSATANGTYTPPEGADGFSSFEVDVPETEGDTFPEWDGSHTITGGDEE